MTAGEPPLVRMDTFLALQKQERYPAFVVHGPPLSGKTTFARALAARHRGAYLDLLAIVAGDASLAERIDQLDAAAVVDLAVTHAVTVSASLLLVDEIDFLIATWGDDGASSLVAIAGRLSVTRTSAMIGFVMQTRPGITDGRLTQIGGGSRVLPLDRIAPL